MPPPASPAHCRPSCVHRSHSADNIAPCVHCAPMRTVCAVPEQCAQPRTATGMLARNRRRWWILGGLCLSWLVLVVDSRALTVAVPQLARDLDASAQAAWWIPDSYGLVFAGRLLTAGSLGDRFGRR